MASTTKTIASGASETKPTNPGSSAAEWAGYPEEYTMTRWYVACTNANHEKRVAEQLNARMVEHFLPMYSSVRRWKDRRVTLQMPVFPGYVFVRIALRDRLRVVQIAGVARLVGFDGRPAALPEEEIEALRAGLGSGAQAEPHPFLNVGRRVRVKDGPMAGLEGILAKRKTGARLVLSVGLIQRAVAVEIDEADVEAVASTNSEQILARTEQVC